MKKKSAVLISLLLSVCLLVGCAAPLNIAGKLTGGNAAQPTENERGSNKPLGSFDDIEYIRPDIEAMLSKAADAVTLLSGGGDYAAVTAALDEYYALYNNFETMYAIADIRSCKDMTDEYYASEYAWCAEAYSELQQITEQLYYACAASQLAAELEEGFFWEGFCEEYADIADAKFSDEYVTLANQETALITLYRELIADPVIEIDGEEYRMYDYLYQADDAGYDEAYRKYYEKYNPLLGEIYIELLKVRRQKAELLGYSSYAEMQYDFAYDRDYSLAEGENFINCVKETIVPLYKELKENAGAYNLYYYWLEEEELLSTLKTVTDTLGGQAQEAYSFMSRHGLHDTSIRENKSDLSFELYLPDYEAPYLFMSPYGDTEDIVTISHEFGHYLDSYIRYNAYESIDLSECFSQSMELLALNVHKTAMDAEQYENLRRMTLLNILDTIVQQCSFAEFERLAYAIDDMSVELLNSLSVELADEYGYYDGVSEEYYAMSWIDTAHFFEAPYYVISYPVAAGVALELYEMDNADPGSGYAKFEEMSGLCTSGLVETVTAAGLSNPLSSERVQAVRDMLSDHLK